MQMPRHVSTNKCSLELKIVSSVKDAGKTEVHYQEILSMFPDENKKDLHTAILTLIEKAFLEPFSSDSPPQTTLYEVNEGPFHPRELI